MTPAELRTTRTALCLTQADLAEDLGTTHTFISHLEAGRKPITPQLEARLARIISRYTNLSTAPLPSLDI